MAEAGELLHAVRALTEQVGTMAVSIAHQDKVLRGDGTTSGLAENVRQTLRLLETMQSQLSGFETRIQHVEAARAAFEAKLEAKLVDTEHRFDLRLRELETSTAATIAETKAAPERAFVMEAKHVLRALAVAAFLALFGAASYGWGARLSAEHPKAPATAGPTPPR